MNEVGGGAYLQGLAIVYVKVTATNMLAGAINVINRRATKKTVYITTSHSPHSKKSKQSVFVIHSRKRQYFRDKLIFKNFIRP